MDASTTKPLTERQAYWLKHIQACKASGQRIADYASTQGINARAMYAGKKELVKKGVLPRQRPTRFQRVKVVDPLMVNNDWRIQLPNGVTVVFAGAADPRTLTTILGVAAAVS